MKNAIKNNLIIILFIIIYILILYKISFFKFINSNKGFDWQELNYLFSEIYINGWTNYFTFHSKFIIYLFLPFYVLFDKSGVILFLIQITINSIIGIYFYLLSKKITKNNIYSILLLLIYLFNNVFFSNQYVEAYIDFFLFIIVILYYIIKKKYKLSLLLLFIFLLIREDSYFISLIIPIYLFLNKKYKKALIFLTFIIIISSTLYFSSKNFFKKKILISNNLIYQNDYNENINTNKLLETYKQYGNNLKIIIKNIIFKPFLLFKTLFSKVNFNLIISIFGILILLVLLNPKLFILYFCIPFLYVLLSNDNSSLKEILHLPLFLSSFYIIILFSIFKIKNKMNKTINFIIILIIIFYLTIQLKKITQNIIKIDSNKNQKIYFDLKKNNTILLKLKKIILKENDGAILLTEKMHYFFKNIDNSYSFWFNTIKKNKNNLSILLLNKEIPINLFVLDFGMDNNKGANIERTKTLKQYVKEKKYFVYHFKFPIIVIKLNNSNKPLNSKFIQNNNKFILTNF